MSKNLEQFEDVKKFDEAVEMLKEIKDLESLFRLWRRAHVLEVEEWKRKYKDKVKTWDKEKRRKIPKTIPRVFKGIKDKEVMEEKMKYSFCGDGYIGTSDTAKEFASNEILNGEPNKFTRFLILKEENHIQKRDDLGKEIQPYNTYYGDWAYNNREVLKRTREKDSKEVTTTATAAKVAEIARYISGGAKKDFDFGSRKEDFQRTEAIKEFAIINLNKRGGSASADEPALENYAEIYKEFLLKEIELLASKETPLEFVVFGKDGGDYFEKMKEILKEKSHKVYNLPHPARVPYEEVKERWKANKELVEKEPQ